MSRIEAPTPPVSVLVVDDEPGPRESIRLVLEPRFRVTTAESGEQALDLLRREKVDVVTLDLMMPGLDGTEVFRKIREIDPALRAIVVSGGSLDDLVRNLPHEASAWFPKPFDTTRLVEAVERAAEETRCGRERSPRSRAADSSPPMPEVRDERKRDAAIMMTHDLKNRMNAIVLSAGLLRKGALDRRRATEALDVIEGNAREAETLMVNFLHVEESDGGSLHLHRTPACLNQILEQVLEDEAARARLKGIELETDFDASLPSANLDVAMISRSLTNLVDNALRYSPKGGVVRLETRRFANVMILRVRDHGPGISAYDLPRLFERYGRGAKSGNSSSTGLGLYLVRTIVEAHGGSVSVTFPPDGGSAFVVVLPSASDGTP